MKVRNKDSNDRSKKVRKIKVRSKKKVEKDWKKERKVRRKKGRKINIRSKKRLGKRLKRKNERDEMGERKKVYK